MRLRELGVRKQCPGREARFLGDGGVPAADPFLEAGRLGGDGPGSRR